MPRSNKFLKYADIPLEQLIIGQGNVRTENVEDGMDELSEHIFVNGLLEAIVVFSIDDLSADHELYQSRSQFKGKYEILAGQRRYNAFLRLNKKHPDEGFAKISCHIRIPPENEDEVKAISIGENLTQLPMTLADAIDACEHLFKKYNNAKIVADKFGIHPSLVRKYVKFARLPKLLQDNLAAYHPKPKTAMVIALDAVDALDYVKDGDVPVEKIHEFAKLLGQKKKKSLEEHKKLKKAAEENPTKSIEEIEKESLKIRNPKKFNVLLEPEHADRLEDAAEKSGISPEDEAHDIIVDGLKTRITKTEKMV